MPSIWNRTLGSDASTEGAWNFSSWIPHAVVINLGTNDWHGCNFPSKNVSNSTWQFVERFTTSYLQLVQRIAAVYGKATEIFLGVGPMTAGYMLPVEWVVGNATAQGLCRAYI